MLQQLVNTMKMFKSFFINFTEFNYSTHKTKINLLSKKKSSMNPHRKLYNHINILSINGGNLCINSPKNCILLKKIIVQYLKYDSSSFLHPKELLNPGQRHLFLSNTAWLLTFFLKESSKGRFMWIVKQL